jgi:hypothetical protein
LIYGSTLDFERISLTTWRLFHIGKIRKMQLS